MTGSPGPTSTGTDSPVSIEASTAEAPSTTTPSVAIFSPGPDDEQVADRELVDRDAPSAPPRSTETSLAPSSSSARSAAPARRLERASKYRPARMNVVTPAAASR